MCAMKASSSAVAPRLLPYRPLSWPAPRGRRRATCRRAGKLGTPIEKLMMSRGLRPQALGLFGDGHDGAGLGATDAPGELRHRGNLGHRARRRRGNNPLMLPQGIPTAALRPWSKRRAGAGSAVRRAIGDSRRQQARPAVDAVSVPRSGGGGWIPLGDAVGLGGQQHGVGVALDLDRRIRSPWRTASTTSRPRPPCRTRCACRPASRRARG